MLLKNAKLENITKGRQVKHTSRFSDVWFGVTHRFIRDDKFPAGLGFLEISFVERYGFPGLTDIQYHNIYGKNYLAGLMIYRSIDPIVLNCNIGYRLNLKRKGGDVTVDPGDVILLQPAVNFAVNDDLTLTWGFKWLRYGRNEINGLKEGVNRSLIQLQWGVGYAWTDTLTLNFFMSAGLSNNQSTDLTLKTMYKF